MNTPITREDVMRQGYNIYGQEQIDQMILTPDSKSTVIIKKAPNMIKIPVYLLDEKGEKVPALDDNGNIRTNENGEMIYVIKEYIEKQDGFIPVQEIVPASEMFSIDFGTGNISHDAVEYLIKTMWRYEMFCVYQQTTNTDYSLYLHKLRNNALAVINSSKSYNGGLIQAIKTFINKTDQNQWLQPQEPIKKPGLFGGLFSKPSNNKQEEEKKTAFDKQGGLNFM